MNNRHKLERFQAFSVQLWQTFLSMLKVILQSGKVGRPGKTDTYNGIVVLGNGPSLRGLIEGKGDFLRDKALMAVNYAVLSDYYNQLKPGYYLVADPVFFSVDEHCDKLFGAMAEKTDWDLDLYLSARARKTDRWKKKLAGNPHIHIRYFNMTPVEGLTCFTHTAFRKGWGCPRPRNVLVPAIMTALRMGYQTIYIAGADHSWLKDTWVNDDNVVMENLPHFYDKKEEGVCASGKRLHDLLLSLHVAFKSYHRIEGFARSIHRKIYNITPGSYIDAFERMKI